MSKSIVTVKQGKLRGILQENVVGGSYFSFKGIPFAAPPVGELRFKDPEPPASWEGIRDASRSGDICAQFEHPPTQIIVGSEDCLYLNVYIPLDLYNNRTKNPKNPVMVWIHGGGYYFGSGNDAHYKPDYLMAKNVILVAISYRLGAFGFLNLGHEVANGNQGMKDQVAALKWIKENIEAFGGDPTNITVFGVGAGSASTHLLTLSPLSKGLFHKAILQSGVCTCDWAMIKNYPEANSFKLARVLGNDSTDPKTVIEFLRTLPVDRIVVAEHQVLTPEEARTLYVPFGPSVDDKAERPFLPISQLLDDDNNIPIMIGHASHEFIYFLRDASEKTLQTMYTDLPRYVRNFVNSQDPNEIAQMTDKIKQKYFDNKLPFTEDSIASIIRWLSDLHFNIPIGDVVDKRRKRKEAPTYFYRFSYNGNQMTETKSVNQTRNSTVKLYKIDASEMTSLYTPPRHLSDLPQYEIHVSNPLNHFDIYRIIEHLKELDKELEPVKESQLAINDRRRKREEAPTYFNRFDYNRNQMTETKLMNQNPYTAIGTSHTDDTSYLFYIPKCKITNPQPPEIGTNDRKILEILTSMWTNFAKNGNPTPALDNYVTTNWLPATADTFNYLNIGENLELLTITDYSSLLQELEL